VALAGAEVCDARQQGSTPTPQEGKMYLLRITY
jgi:hypothetical protein